MSIDSNQRGSIRPRPFWWTHPSEAEAMSTEEARSHIGPPAKPKVFGFIPMSRFYQGRRATPLGRWFSRFWAAWSALGLPSFRMVKLELRGPKTGKPLQLAVVPVRHAGQQYLVS